MRKVVKHRKKDRLSELPDEILVMILSLLDFKEAVQSSVLSHRWERLWTEYTGSLNFKAATFRTKDVKKSTFVRWVNYIVEMHKGSKIHEFKFQYNLKTIHEDFIDKCLDFALKRRVQKLELDLVRRRTELDERYCLPGKYLNFSPQLQSSLFKSLTWFSVKFVNVSGEFLEMLLLNCPLLEKQSVHHSNHLKSFKVAGGALRLKHLEILFCWNVERIDVSVPSLLSFKYGGNLTNVHVKNVPCLTEVAITGINEGEMSSSLDSLGCYFPQLTILHIEFKASEVEDDTFDRFPLMGNLRQLHLRCTAYDNESVLEWTYVLKASPNLQKFTFSLNFMDTSYDSDIENFGCRGPYPNLKELEFMGFEGRVIDYELALFCVENAPMIEKLVVDCRDPDFLDSPHLLEEKELAKRRALELQAKLPPSAKFVLL